MRAELLARSEELYAAVRADYGKPAFEAWLTEIFPSIEEINCATKNLKVWMKGRRARGTLILPLASTRVRYEPKGRALIMSPWNYPVQLLVAPLVAAVAAGNCIIAKPSNKTPRTAAFLADLIGSVFPPDEVAVVGGPSSTVGDFLLELPFDHIFFTGSPAVGVKVGEAAARLHAGLTLELGGKSPTILLRGAMESFYGKTEEDSAASPDFPRIVNKAACARLERLVEDAIKRARSATSSARGP